MNPDTPALGTEKNSKAAESGSKEESSSNIISNPTSSSLSFQEGHDSELGRATEKSNCTRSGDTMQGSIAHTDNVDLNKKDKSNYISSAIQFHDDEGGKQGEAAMKTNHEPSGEKNGSDTMVIDSDGPSSPETMVGDSPSPVAQLNVTEQEQKNISKAENTVEKQEQKLIQNLEMIRDGTTDTAKFVGLYLFHSNLKEMPDLVRNLELMAKCWGYIPGDFLDRLFIATEFKGQDPEHIIERNIVIGLAVNIIYTFATFVPTLQTGDSKIAERIPGLIAALNVKPMLPEDARYEILQVLQMYVTTPLGAAFLLDDQSLAILVQAATQDQVAFKILRRAFVVEASCGQSAALLSRFNDTMSRLVNTFRDVPNLAGFFAGAAALVFVISKELPDQPPWLGEMARVLRESSVKQKGREAATTFAAALLHTYPMHFPAILFDSTDYTMYKGKERKSLSWHFTQLRAIDIQITLASIREQVGTPGYQSIENRLIVSHHVLVAFIHFLNGRNFRDFLERPEDVQAPLPYTHKVVLKIRDEMSECLRKTIKYLCDRYEDGLAAVFKDNGSTLPSIRTMIDDNKAATLMSHEPLVVASVDALACWLEQDASVKLREDAADMMDVLLKLYNPNPALRMPIIAIVEHTLGTSHGMENFALRRGWEIFFRDFESIVLPDQPAAAGKPDDKTIARGSRILHVFAAVSDYGLRYHRQLQGTPQADRWNEILQLTTRLNSEGASALWDLKLALLNTMSDLVNLAAERKVITVESGRVRDVVKRVDRLLRTARRG